MCLGVNCLGVNLALRKGRGIFDLLEGNLAMEEGRARLLPRESLGYNVHILEQTYAGPVIKKVIPSQISHKVAMIIDLIRGAKPGQTGCLSSRRK